jgi:thioredoxin 1
MAEWKNLLASSAAKKQLLIIDAYAMWCPPCKAIAPVYARLSEEFTAESTLFAKVDVDKCGELSTELKISAMPTFKFFREGQEVATQRGGVAADKFRELILAHGGTRAAS